MGPECCTAATFDSLHFPPNLERVHDGSFRESGGGPVDLVFPPTLKSIGATLQGVRVRRVDFGRCVNLMSLTNRFLSKATLDVFVFPPNVTTVGEDFMSGVDCPTLDLRLPPSVTDCAEGFLGGSRVGAVDLAGASFTAIPPGFMKRATAQQLMLPPVIVSVGDGSFCDFTCKTFDFVAPETLKSIGSEILWDATIASVDVSGAVLLESIGNSFLAGAKLDTPASLTFTNKLKSIGSGFCSGTKLQRLDMRTCNSVTELPEFFLFRTECIGADESSDECLILPPLVSKIGGSCFALSKGFTDVHLGAAANGDSAASDRGGGSVTSAAQPTAEARANARLRGLVLSNGSLSVGDSFAAGSDVELVSWAYRRVVVGHSFCKDLPAFRMPCARGFAVVGDDFCAGIGDLNIDLAKAPLTRIGSGFLQRSTFGQDVNYVDLGRAMFTECPEFFMFRSCFNAAGGRVVLPATVATIAPSCCAEVTRLESFSFAASTSPLAPTAIELSIERDFLRDCRALTTAELPDCVVSFGDCCFANCPALSVTLTLPHIRRIGNNFIAQTDRGGGEPHSPLSFSPRDQGRQEASADNAALQKLASTVALHNVCPHVSIGNNFAAYVNCTVLTFAAAHSALQDERTFVKRDELFKELDGALSAALAAGLLEPVVALKELVSLRKQLLLAMAEAQPGFRGIAVELDAISNADMEDDYTKRDRVDRLAEEMRCEEDHIFRAPICLLSREKLKRLGPNSQVGVEARDQGKDAPTIGDGFLAHTVGISRLDMSGAMHASVGDRFAAHSSIHELQLPMSVTAIGKDLCVGCLATVSAAPSGGAPDDCYLSSWMDIRIEKERMDTLTHFRDLLPTSEWAGMARWLLQQKCFAEFKGLFNVREDAANLRHVGGTVDDLPGLPENVPAWPGFGLTVSTHDSCLSLLHWAVKYSHQYPHLLGEASWSLADLTLVTEQGFTALHYAVLYNIETAALKTLLDIAAKAEIHGTWTTAWSSGGVRVSPLHLAYLYRRDTIVRELLAFEWDPTEPIKDADTKSIEGSRTGGGGDNFDAFDQAVMELGQARTAAFLDAQDATASDEKALRLPVAVQLFYAAVLMCVVNEFESGLDHAHSIDGGIHRAFIVLRHRLTTDFPLLSQNKWSQARQQQRDIAARGSSEEEIIDARWVHEFLQDAFAAAFSDPDHSSHVRIQYRHVLADTGALKAFVMAEFAAQLSQKRALTFALVGEMVAKVQGRFRSIRNARQGSSAPPITTETLLLRTQSMEEGPHRSNVEEKLANVIPFRFVIPVLPFFYLMLLIVFGLSWFFHPPILAPTLMGIENAIADCTNPYSTKDATEDGVIPWDCDVGFTELGMQVETFPKPTSTKTSTSTTVAKMQSFFSFIEKDKISCRSKPLTP